MRTFANASNQIKQPSRQRLSRLAVSSLLLPLQLFGGSGSGRAAFCTLLLETVWNIGHLYITVLKSCSCHIDQTQDELA
jgi:hypothetical protein